MQRYIRALISGIGQAEPGRGSGPAGRLPAGQDGRDTPGAAHARSHIQQSAHDEPGHLVQEGRSFQDNVQLVIRGR